MTLGNMRELGVRSLDVMCSACRHEVVLNVDAWPDDMPVPAFGPRMVCRRCGNIGAARLGADVVRSCFIVSDFHRLLLAGLPAHFVSDMPRQVVRRAPCSKKEPSRPPSSATTSRSVSGPSL